MVESESLSVPVSNMTGFPVKLRHPQPPPASRAFLGDMADHLEPSYNEDGSKAIVPREPRRNQLACEIEQAHREEGTKRRDNGHK